MSVNNYQYTVTKTYGNDRGFSCVFRQYKADSHCRYLHGYSLGFEVVIGLNDMKEPINHFPLDQNNWVFDFGKLKELKKFLERNFDHTMMVAKNDPELKGLKKLQKKGLADIRIINKVSVEKFAEVVLRFTDDLVRYVSHGTRHCVSVKCSEHSGNSATVYSNDSNYYTKVVATCDEYYLLSV